MLFLPYHIHISSGCQQYLGGKWIFLSFSQISRKALDNQVKKE